MLSELEKYDAEKNTQLYDTLMTYTLTGFSKNRTAGAHVPAPEHGELPHTADIGALRTGLFGQRADVQAAILLPRGLLPEAPLLHLLPARPGAGPELEEDKGLRR